MTVVLMVAVQPVGKVYVITGKPWEIPVTTPDEEPTVASNVLLLLQVPPGEAELNVTGYRCRY